jgi:hypothetical protein
MGCFMEKLMPHFFCLGVKLLFSSLDVMSPQDRSFSMLIHEVPFVMQKLIDVLCAVSATKIVGPVF